MINSIRAVRKAKRLTLEEVAQRCDPPTTAQTIGRLETGMRRLSLPWMATIAKALDVSEAELVRMPGESQMMVAALLGPDGAAAPAKPEDVAPLRAEDDMIAIRVTGSIGDYRHGDIIWCQKCSADRIADHRNRDVLLPRPAGRYIFGRLLDSDGHNVQILPLAANNRQQILPIPAWGAVAVRLIRAL
jgi:transcriptional regulator with XRE-family HTH domain